MKKKNDENNILLEGNVLNEGYKIIKSPSDIDPHTNANTDLEKYKTLLKSGNYREFKSNDKNLVENTLKNKKFIKVFIGSLIAAGLALSGIHLAKKRLSNSAIGKMDKKLSSCEEPDIDDDDFFDDKSYDIMMKTEKTLHRIDKGEKIAKAGAVAGALGISQNLAKNIKVTYTVFKYKGMTVISVLPKGGKITQTKRQLKNCYAVLVKTGKNEAVVLKKLKSIASKEA